MSLVVVMRIKQNGEKKYEVLDLCSYIFFHLIVFYMTC